MRLQEFNEYCKFSRIGASARTNAYFGQGNSSSKTLHFDCNGSETSLLHCSIPNTGTCSHSDDVGVVCPYTNTELIRLVNGPSLNQGRIEMSLDNGATWGTVCGNLGTNGAGVVCAALGYPREGATYKGYSVYGQGSSSQPILFHYPTCDGTETSLLDCKRSTSTCSHTYDVGVMCIAEPTTLVRLVNIYIGTMFNKGRVELSVDNGTTWGTICNDYFGDAEAKVICRMLGFHEAEGVAVINGSYGFGSGQILLDDLNCSGEETSILQCQHKPIGENDCTHDEDVGVACNYVGQGSAEVRLTGSSSRYQGRVEVKLAGTTIWGTICSLNDFDSTEASVICAMLGFQRSGAVARLNAYFGQGTESQPIILSHLGLLPPCVRRWSHLSAVTKSIVRFGSINNG
ncbi:hypothetical protein DPMN_149082 [Dreissena polymorpha]|uniref:SRCR domain-containing protein n=1 Tax=Dreissena polymorpha TaxID=45954 RepID=A0A9D4FGS0_DREPO|nr:hypothetical protein DPMN_149082 [Dreissena polymorpha]